MTILCFGICTRAARYSALHQCYALHDGAVHSLECSVCAKPKLYMKFLLRSALKSFSAQTSPAPPPPPEKTSYGGLKDEDRIFTNLYRQGDPFLKVTLDLLLVPVSHEALSSVLCMSFLSSASPNRSVESAGRHGQRGLV